MRPTESELDNAALRDLLIDAQVSEEQAITGPFYCDRVGGGREITTDPVKIAAARAELLFYAAKCRATIARWRVGGAHNAIMKE